MTTNLRPLLTQTLDAALDFLHSLDTAPVTATVTPTDLRHRFLQPLNPDPLPPEQVIADLVANTRDALTGMAGGRFFAWAIGGSLPAALAADWLTTAWDQNGGLYASSPAASMVEVAAATWLKQLLGLPAAASFAFVTGCQMAHLTCLAAARHHVYLQHGIDLEAHGLAGAPPPRILTSNRHGSIDRAVHLLGLGSNHIEELPLDHHIHLTPETLQAALAADPTRPTIVILQCGDLNTGSYDDYATLIPLAHRHHAWVHIDGAFGLWAAASPQLRHLTRGVELADSWATDGHKWLNVPYDCGYAFTAHPISHRAAMSHHVSYLIHDPQAYDQLDWTPEWSRRARGFATYAALRQLGTTGVADLINRCCRHAHTLTQALAQLPGVQLIHLSDINQGLVRFLDPRPAATEPDHDTFTDRVVTRIRNQGRAFFVASTWQSRRVMRISVLNWQTSDHDIEVAIEAVAEALQEETKIRSPFL